MKKKFFALLAMIPLALTSCGGAGTYSDYTKDLKDNIVTNINNITSDDESETESKTVDYFTKTIELPIVIDEDGTPSNVRNSYTLTYKKNDGYRLTEQSYNSTTKETVITSDVLYDIKHEIISETETTTDVYTVTKYVLDTTDGKYFRTEERDEFIDGSEGKELWNELYSETDGLVVKSKIGFYSELLDYGDINDITYENFRSLSSIIIEKRLSYNSFIDGKQHIIDVTLTNVDVFDMNLENISNILTRGKYYIKSATIDGSLGIKCSFDLKAVFLEDNDSIFGKEVDSLKAPTLDLIKTDTTVIE